MPLIRDIITALESQAPLGLQEEYDNCGLQVGDSNKPCTGVLLVVDATPEAVDEAARLGDNLIVSHHPLLFKGVKHLTGKTLVERTAMKAIKADIAIYSLHTALDNAPEGISHEMARRLGLCNVRTLAPMAGQLLKLVTFVPCDHTQTVSAALFAAGAGKMGRYDSCSFASRGEGSFRALEGAKPFVGEVGAVHHEPEVRLEVLVPRVFRQASEQALLKAHPYEHPAYEFIAIDNRAPQYGSGAVGDLTQAMEPQEFVELVKSAFNSPVARCTAVPEHSVKRIALCGGSGSFLLRDAIAAGAEAFITSDTSYHNFIDFAPSIFIVDIGHYESEECSKQIFYRIITKFFPNFAVHYSKTEKNPITYL